MAFDWNPPNLTKLRMPGPPPDVLDIAGAARAALGAFTTVRKDMRDQREAARLEEAQRMLARKTEAELAGAAQDRALKATKEKRDADQHRELMGMKGAEAARAAAAQYEELIRTGRPQAAEAFRKSSPYYNWKTGQFEIMGHNYEPPKAEYEPQFPAAPTPRGLKPSPFTGEDTAGPPVEEGPLQDPQQAAARALLSYRGLPARAQVVANIATQPQQEALANAATADRDRMLAQRQIADEAAAAKVLGAADMAKYKAEAAAFPMEHAKWEGLGRHHLNVAGEDLPVSLPEQRYPGRALNYNDWKHEMEPQIAKIEDPKLRREATTYLNTMAGLLRDGANPDQIHKQFADFMSQQMKPQTNWEDDPHRVAVRMRLAGLQADPKNAQVHIAEEGMARARATAAVADAERAFRDVDLPEDVGSARQAVGILEKIADKNSALDTATIGQFISLAQAGDKRISDKDKPVYWNKIGGLPDRGESFASELLTGKIGDAKREILADAARALLDAHKKRIERGVRLAAQRVGAVYPEQVPRVIHMLSGDDGPLDEVPVPRVTAAPPGSVVPPAIEEGKRIRALQLSRKGGKAAPHTPVTAAASAASIDERVKRLRARMSP